VRRENMHRISVGMLMSNTVLGRSDISLMLILQKEVVNLTKGIVRIGANIF
jgi:hypothetical protein